MKLVNRKTGEIGNLLGTNLAAGIICIGVDFHDGNPKEYCYSSLTELNEEWEDVKSLEFSKYYLINEETGVIATFDDERQMKIFQNEIDGWKPVKVILDGEKYIITKV